MTEPRSKGATWIASAALVLVTVLAYLPTLRYGFVYDDPMLIVTNTRLTSWSYLPSYFAHHFWYNVSNTGSYYRPLVLVWFRALFATFQANPVAWHAAAILLHGCAGVLAFLLLRRTFLDFFSAFLAALIFVLHPAHIESVAWVSGMSDSLAAVPVFGCLLLWLQYRQGARRVRLAWSLLAFLSALLVKESAALAVMLIFVYAFAEDEDESMPRRLMRAGQSVLPFVAVFLGYFAVRWIAIHKEYAPAVRPLRSVIANLPEIAGFYTFHLLWPFRVQVLYAFELANHSAIRGLLVAAAVLGMLWLAARRSARVLIALSWIVAGIAPAVAGIASFDPHDYVHDRYLYLPTLGFGMLVVLAVGHLERRSRLERGRSLVRIGVAVLICVAFGLGTAVQAAPWQNNGTLFTAAIRSAPRNPIGYNHLAFELYRHNQSEAAAQLYQQAVALDPEDYRSNFGLAVLSFRMQDWQAADHYCEQANRLAPHSNNVCYQFQTISRMNFGRWAEAEIPIRKAIGGWPQITGQHVLLGQILEHQGDALGAKQEFEEELRLDPTSVAAQTGLEELENSQRSMRKPR